MSKEGRVSKSRARKKDKLPIVERTNQLSLEEFISTYCSESKPKDSKHKDEDSKNEREEDYRTEIYTSETLPGEIFEKCFRLIESTSSKTYLDSSIGWSPLKKRKEMKLPDMRYIILQPHSQDTSSLTDGLSEKDNDCDFGFLSFMVTYEDGQDVLYCYEIHLSPAAQGKGLGEMLMKTYEDIGQRIGLKKCMLTVFRVNEGARRFYARLGYGVDEYSPPPRILRNGTVKEADYLILSKRLETRSA
ncbi:hypothetical protein ASPZODRAFT_27259 [Penicilliopsis zonata CBS 506.65]|uniref:N-alpha-acetyltransferase 40 n=1 Tax=Penicilliopsis zonata CBS 506.65 TaxID=1073090 RepID=A0A1L9SBL7_9EURO|nr:hypothetical protein ASPZODRAFT_27259 [Penicilliopsis zonata CBS 506.65]OJJ44605.1 hypothetical protein ASPZODRAFT_27259 [Penicilliopsis zonata CBS 506.65]